MNPDIQPHELADMRIAADKAPFGVREKMNALLDAYEGKTDADTLQEELDELKSKAEDATIDLREVFPDEPASARRYRARNEFGEPLSEEAWHEKLEDCQTPEELLKTVADELERTRAAEVKLRERVEALEDAVENALGELED